MNSVGLKPDETIQSQPRTRSAGLVADASARPRSPPGHRDGRALFPSEWLSFRQLRRHSVCHAECQRCKHGLTWKTVRWAFTTYRVGTWHPVTWLSHALDCQLFDLDPAGPHDVNLLLHVLNVVLLFWVLQQATGFTGRSFMVAALFALHPINVESVVWIAERKNSLSMLFFLLALAAYRWYVSQPQGWTLRRGRGFVCAWTDGQAAGHHLPLRSAAVGLLAVAAIVIALRIKTLAQRATNEVGVPGSESLVAGWGKDPALRSGPGSALHDHERAAG